MKKTKQRSESFVMSDASRIRIQDSDVLNALIEHAEGRRDMSSSQVSAGLGLLKKVLPDISTVTLQGNKDNPISIAFKTIYEGKPVPPTNSERGKNVR